MHSSEYKHTELQHHKKRYLY